MKKLSFVTILMLIFALCFNSCYSDTSCKPEETPYKSDEMSSDSTISETAPESMVSDYVSGEETTAEITVGEDTASESPQYHPVIDSIPDEFMAVINNTEKFIFCRYSDECEEIYLDVFSFPYMGEKITYGNGVEYAVLDMNGDNKLEVVLMSALGDKLVLHCQNGIRGKGRGPGGSLCQSP